MHYTSIENIHKVIDPLFLDGLRGELTEIKTVSVERTRKAKLEAFQRKLAGLTFLDPACGSGNFLTETYISLRRLENEVVSLIVASTRKQMEGQILLGGEGIINPIQVSIGQFYGIEINDFAVTVAKTALWIAESQMMKETEDIVHMSLDFLPLKSYANITEGNAIRLDWESVVDKRRLNYIMGNPPFVGYSLQSKSQTMWMRRAKRIRRREKSIMCPVGISKRHSSCAGRRFGQRLCPPIPLHRVSKWRASGSRFMSVLAFTLTSPIARSAGIARPA